MATNHESQLFTKVSSKHSCKSVLPDAFVKQTGVAVEELDLAMDELEYALTY
ncbi:MAG: hypothetical protein HUJ63_13855 [Enterococcus sp.]|nr:hypothetical protein [Enterococcus sp.]